MAKKPARDIEKDIMFHHGTIPYQPSAKVIYDTALASYRYVSRGQSKMSAFLPAHVRGAKSVTEVLQNAIKGIHDGRKASSVETKIVYRCEHTLIAALAIAKAADGALSRA